MLQSAERLLSRARACTRLERLAARPLGCAGPKRLPRRRCRHCLALRRFFCDCRPTPAPRRAATERNCELPRSRDRELNCVFVRSSPWPTTRARESEAASACRRRSALGGPSRPLLRPQPVSGLHHIPSLIKSALRQVAAGPSSRPSPRRRQPRRRRARAHAGSMHSGPGGARDARKRQIAR